MDASWEDYETDEEIQDRLACIDSVCQLLADREEDEVVLYNLDDCDPLLTKKHIIAYSHDTHNYKLGAIVL